MDPTSLLCSIGLSSNEARVYASLLKLKKATVSKIASESRSNRSTTYNVLHYLEEKGLIGRYIENKKIGFFLDTPNRLIRWIKNIQRVTEEREKFLHNHFSVVEYAFKATPETPTIRYFEGSGQLEDFFNDSFLSNPKKIYGYASSKLAFTQVEQRYVRYYARERFRRNIHSQYIVNEVDRETVREFKKKFYQRYLNLKPGLFRIKILPTEGVKNLLNETIIYGNKLAISHFGEKFFGLIIENDDVASTQRIVFEFLWKTLKEEI